MVCMNFVDLMEFNRLVHHCLGKVDRETDRRTDGQNGL